MDCLYNSNTLDVQLGVLHPWNIQINGCFAPLKQNPKHSLDRLALLVLALYSGPLRRGERAWYTLYTHALGNPRRQWDTIVYSPFIVHRATRHANPRKRSLW